MQEPLPLSNTHRPYLLSQRLTELSPVAKLAIAVLQQAIIDSNRPGPDVDKTPGATRTAESTPWVIAQNRKSAREWLQEGYWQEITDRLGIRPSIIQAHLAKTCPWYKL